MQTIPITIQNKIASVPCGTFIVADNPTEYQLLFTFDSEWSGYSVKTARFLVGRYYTDVDFTGNTVTIPSMPSNVSKISVGVYADLLATTTPANISVMPSVLATAESATQYDPAEPTVLPDIDALALDDTFVVNDVSEGEKARATIGQVVDYVQSASQIEPADTNPLMDGEANVGSSDKYARGDHVHPTDTSRASQTGLDTLEYAVQNIGMIVAPMSDVVSELMNTVGEIDRDAIKMTAQSLTTAQQAQARSNINAASIDDIGTVFTIKGEVANISDLPATGNTVGDVYYVSSVHAGYVWLETTDHPNGYWEELGEPIDLSAYRTAAAQDVIDGAQDTAIAAKYTKPSSGIPKTDLASDVQSSLGKADTALQTAPVSSVNGQTGAVTLSIPATADDVGAIAAPSSPNTGDVLIYNGSTWVAGQAGLSNDAKAALLALLEKVAYIDEHGQDYIDDFEDALNGKTLTSITAVFTQGQAVIYDTDTLDDLRQYLVVTAHYSDNSTATVTDYTLSGTLTAGTSTITAMWRGKSDTFTVAVSATSAYTPLTYIQADGNSYINIWYVPDQNTKIVLDYMSQKASGVSFQCPIGVNASTTAEAGNKQFMFYIGSANNVTTGVSNATGNTKVFDNITVNDGDRNTYSLSKSDFSIGTTSYGAPQDNVNNALNTSVGYPFYVFARNHGNTLVRAMATGRVYELSIYSGNTLVKHYSPAKRTSDNVCGLLETTSNTFYTNSGSGTITGA